jgi:hypothetical protein
MNDDYLWNLSGPPDPDIERLERALAPLRYGPRALAPPRPRPAVASPWRVAAAAGVILAAMALWRFAVPAPAATPWQVSGIEGQARLGARAAAIDMAVPGGQTIQTGAASTLFLRAEDTGQIDLGPDSVMHAASGRKIALERGELHAFIWARPGQFVVDTPSARAIDLGCEYTLSVDAAGNGRLRVSMGWVAFQFDGREAFIPAGAQCATRQRGGPGVPFFEDAPQPLRRAVGEFDAGDARALTAILRNARVRDALTLWHLLPRVAGAERGAVYDRFAELVKLPPEVTRAAALRADAHTLDLCWDALGLENTEWWRGWERKW